MKREFVVSLNDAQTKLVYFKYFVLLRRHNLDFDLGIGHTLIVINTYINPHRIYR